MATSEAATATVQSVARPRGELTDSDQVKLAAVMREWESTEATRDELRQVLVNLVGRSSFRAVSEATGISTNTLQRWKREANG